MNQARKLIWLKVSFSKSSSKELKLTKGTAFLSILELLSHKNEQIRFWNTIFTINIVLATEIDIFPPKFWLCNN